MTAARELATLTPDQRRQLLRDLLERDPRFPLSAGQEWLWLLQQHRPRSPAYLFPFALRIRSAVDVEALARALQGLVDRHEAFRTQVELRGARAMQLAHETLPFELQHLDASGWSEELLRSRVTEHAQRPFDVSRAPLFRATLFQRAPDDAVLLLVWHHVVLDGWSLGVVLDELGTLYDAQVAGRTPALPPATPYRAFVQWQRDFLASDEGARQRAYWSAALEGAERLDLVGDRPRATERDHERRGGSVLFTLGSALSRDVAHRAAAEHTTTFVVLMAAFEALLHRVSGRENVLVSFPVSGRTDARFARTAGYIASQVSIASRFDVGTTFRDVFRGTQASVLGALEHQSYHLSLLGQADAPNGDTCPRFSDVMFVLQQATAYRLDHPEGVHREPAILEPRSGTTRGRLGTLVVESFSLDADTARFDLELQMMEHGDTLYGWLQYDRDRFDDETARAFVRRFQRLVAASIADPEQRVDAVDVLDTDERARIVAWNATGRAWPDEGDLADMFERQAARTPNALAAMCDDERVTFSELDVRANRVAQWLRRGGARPGDLVGLAVPRSVEAIVALLGIVKAGCAYVPLDPANPAERLRYIVEDSRTAFVITASETCGWFRHAAVQHLCLHCDAREIARSQATRPPRNRATTAYVVYTSGSTGAPKGVIGTTRGTINRLRWMWERFPFAADEIVAQTTTLAFVDAVWEIFGPLLRGVPIAIVRDDAVRDLERLTSALQRHGATRITVVPALLRVLVDAPRGARRLHRLRYVTCSGEALDAALARRFMERFPNAALLNLYGCSEASGDSCCFELPRGWSGDRVPIGAPIANTSVWLLDAHGALVPPGSVGEIHIGGAGLAAGYLHRPELTAERFIRDPFSTDPDARLYRTGDLGRQRADGAIEYFGRADRQVKVRGNRIELGEVESALRAHPDVETAAVQTVAEPSGDHTLAAYVVARSPLLTDNALRAHLTGRLPAYMLPSHYVRMDAMPRTATGKLDRRALPLPDVGGRAGTYVAPRTETERTLAGIWAAVLNVPRIGVQDDFFEWGGHSLLALQAAARASEAFHRQLPADLVVRLSTVASLAAYLDGERGSGRPHRIVDVQPAGTRPPLFWIPGGAGSLVLTQLRGLARRLGPDQPLHGLGTRRAESLDEVESVEERARAYVEAIRERQPEGPYHLIGFCLGGVIAFEMAQQLRAAGERVAFLGLINTWMPATSIQPQQWLAIAAQRVFHHARTGAPRHVARRVRGALASLRRTGARSDAGPAAHALVSDDEILDATIRLASQYVPRRLDAAVHVFLSDEPHLRGVSARIDPRTAWRRVCTRLDATRVRGDHDAVLDSAFVDDFARQVSDALRSAQSRGTDRR